MAEVAIASVVAGSALQATGQIMSGREQSRAAAFEQQQLEVNRQNNEIQAAQAETRRREELTQSIETIQAIRAGRGVGGGSPTEAAIFDSIGDNATRDIDTERFNYNQRGESLRLQAGEAGRRSRMSLLSGYLGAATTVANTGARIYGMRR